MVDQAGMGITRLSWEEINAWAERVYSFDTVIYQDDGCGVYIPVSKKVCALSTWELLTIKSLSEIYASEFSLSDDPDREAPYTPATIIDDKIDRQAVTAQVINVMQRFASMQSRPKHVAS